jgi:hypothetical protein
MDTKHLANKLTAELHLKRMDVASRVVVTRVHLTLMARRNVLCWESGTLLGILVSEG